MSVPDFNAVRENAYVAGENIKDAMRGDREVGVNVDDVVVAEIDPIPRAAGACLSEQPAALCQPAANPRFHLAAGRRSIPQVRLNLIAEFVAKSRLKIAHEQVLSFTLLARGSMPQAPVVVRACTAVHCWQGVIVTPFGNASIVGSTISLIALSRPFSIVDKVSHSSPLDCQETKKPADRMADGFSCSGDDA